MTGARATLIWLGAGTTAALAISWVAAILSHHRIAPIGILSVGVGIALGTSLRRIAKWQQLAGRRRMMLGAAVFAILAILAQHAWLYAQFCSGWRRSRAENAQIALFRPESPWSPREYFAREIDAGSLPYWCLDAAIILIATVVTLHLQLGNNEPREATADHLTSDT